MTTDITELAQSLKAAAENAIGAHERLAAYPYGEIIDISQYEGEQIDIDITDINEFHEEANPVNVLALVEALDKAQQQMTESENRVRKQNRHICELFDDNTALRQRIAELESRTVKLPDGWQFEECEAEDCENGAIFSVGTGSRNIHLCDKCAHEPQNSRLKKSPLSKRLPFKMSAGIKVEAE
ncbi:ead/Ea22-like family protein [Klebsiella pneumoniae]